ncbi:MAG: AAA family ATPase [Verrucomicrobia bacterium]|nr:AAA family ATPase [Verrucomicrobiota bacterium]
MPNLSVSDPVFFWESYSRFQRFKVWLGFEPALLTELKESLDQFSVSNYYQPKIPRIAAEDKSAADSVESANAEAKKSIKPESSPIGSKVTPLHRAVAYLGDNSDPRIEKIVAQKLSQAPPLELKIAISHLVSFSIKNDRLKMIEVCQKVLQLQAIKEVFNIEEDIQPVIQGLERHIIQKRNKTSDAHSSYSWNFPFPSFRNVRYFRHYITTLVGLAYGIDFTERPTSRWAAQYQLSFFRSTLSDIQSLGTQYLKYFSSTRKAALVAAAIFTAFATAYLLYSKINRSATDNSSKPPPSLDKQLFTDLTEKARAGLIPPAYGIETGMRLVETCFSSSENTNPLIVLLLGPPGSGKTRYPEELARRIANKETACLNDKRVYIVNTADMGEKGSWSENGNYVSRMDKIFESLEGFEDEVILCFDEAHMFDKKTANQLKTKLIQRKIRTMLATTPFEFGGSFLDQEPLISRGQIGLVGSLNRENTECACLGLLKANPDIQATPKAIEDLLEFSVTLSGAEPRKSLKLLSYLIHTVHSSVPRPHPVVSFLARKYAKAGRDFDYQMFLDPLYDFTDKGKEALKKKDLIDDSIKQLNEHHSKRLKLFASIKTLQKTQSKYRDKCNFLAENLARLKDPSEEKEYLFLRFAIIPILHQRIKSLIEELREMKPTAELLKCKEMKVLDDQEYALYFSLPQEEVHFIIDEDLIKAKKHELEENHRINMQNSTALKKQHPRSKPIPQDITRSASHLEDTTYVSATNSSAAVHIPPKPVDGSPPASPAGSALNKPAAKPPARIMGDAPVDLAPPTQAPHKKSATTTQQKPNEENNSG